MKLCVLTSTNPRSLNFIFVFSNPNPFVTGDLPIAINALSNSNSFSSKFSPSNLTLIDLPVSSNFATFSFQ